MEREVIPHTEGRYSATRCGEIIVHSRERTIPSRWPGRSPILCKIKEKILRKINHTGGYDAVSVLYKGVMGKRYVHRLVAETFLGENPGMVVNHIDHNKKNNCVENLEWTTPKGNSQHSIKHMRHGGPHGKQRYSISDRKVIAEYAIKHGIKTAAEQFNLYFGYVNKLAFRYRQGEFDEVA